MFHANSFENSRSDGFSVLEFSGESDADPAQPRRFVPLQRTELTGEIVGPLATLQLHQRFHISAELYDKPIEAVYRFPLPGDAAIVGVTVRFGDVEIRAELQERSKAETEYQAAKDQGRQAALVTRESPDVFTLQVAGIQPDQNVDVETRYVQVARAAGLGWSLRIPLTTSPRYVRWDESTSRHAKGQPLYLLRDPGHRFSLDLAFVGTEGVRSPTHLLETSVGDGRCRVTLQQQEIVPDRDCVLNWAPLQANDRPLLHVALYDDLDECQTYFLGLLAPPVRTVDTTIPREVTLLVDHSGSMEGAKWQAADWAVKRFLSDLTESDHFALGLFHDSTKWHSKGLLRGDTKNIANAISFLEQHRDNGGTELGVALEQALDRPPGSGEAARHIVIITDAEVSDAGRILRLAEQESGQPGRRRIDVLCIDAAPNSYLAEQLAERGGGVARFLTSDPQEVDITTALDEVLNDWAQPVATGLRLEVDRDQIQSAERSVIEVGKRQSIDLGDLPSGRSLWFCGRVPRGNGQFEFRILTSANRIAASCNASVQKSGVPQRELKMLFGARRLAALEYLITSGYESEEWDVQLRRMGYDPAAILADTSKQQKKVYAENVTSTAATALNRLLVRESLKFGLACSETAFIATREEAGVPVDKRVFVANALPHGWSDEFTGGGAFIGCLMASAPSRGYGGSVQYDLLEMDEFDDALDESDDDDFDDTVDSGVTLSAPTSQQPMARMAQSIARSPASDIVNRGLVFDDTVSLNVTELMLFDTSRDNDAKHLPDDVRLVGLEIAFTDKSFDTHQIGRDVTLQIFVEDLAVPRATVRLADLIRQKGVRPLNLKRETGQSVRVVLVGSANQQTDATPVKIWLSWE